MKKISFEHEHLNHYDGQDDYELGIYDGDDVVGYVDYTIYNNEITISDILVKPNRRREGFGSMLVKKMKNLHPNAKYIPSYKTELGSKFIHKDVDISEARRNPETNIDYPIYQQIKQFVDKYQNQQDLLFVSFRNSQDVTFINPNNEYETPTGLYTYPWENYYRIKYIEQIENKIAPDIYNTVPFAGDRKYMFIYKLKSNQGILTNKSTYNELLSYAKNLLSVLKQQGSSNISLVDDYINNFEDGFMSVIRDSSYYKENTSDVKLFWLMLYAIAREMGGKLQYKVSALCRSIGINGFVDFGSGFIHPNEPYQALFFKGREIFEDYKIIDLKEKKSVFLKNVQNLDFENINYLLKQSKEPDKIINRLLQSQQFINNLDYSGIFNLLKYSKEPDKVKQILISKGGNSQAIKDYFKLNEATIITKDKLNKLIESIIPED